MRSSGEASAPELHRNGELAAWRETRCMRSSKRAILLAVLRGGADRRLDAFLPAAVQEQSAPAARSRGAARPRLAVAQHAQFFEQFAHQRRPSCRAPERSARPTDKREISFSPQRALPPACGSISSSTKSRKPRLSSRHAALKSGDAAADDDDRNLDLLRCGCGERRAIAQPVAELVAVVDEAAGDGALRLARQPDERRRSGTGGGERQCAMSLHSCS